jgi:hypothetical protein
MHNLITTIALVATSAILFTTIPAVVTGAFAKKTGCDPKGVVLNTILLTLLLQWVGVALLIHSYPKNFVKVEVDLKSTEEVERWLNEKSNHIRALEEELKLVKEHSVDGSIEH